MSSIGVNEVLWQRGHKYLTVVYDNSECKSLLWVGGDRTIKTLLGFFRMFGKQRSAQLLFICSDMWKPYLKVIAKKASHVLDMVSRVLDSAGQRESSNRLGLDLLRLVRM